MLVDLLFKVNYAGSGGIPADHGYALFSAVSHALETPSDQWLHNNAQVGLHTIRGTRIATNKIQPHEAAKMGLRLPADLVSKALQLAGKKIKIDGQAIRLGLSQTHPLRPAATLYSPIVTTKNGDDVARFDAEITRQLTGILGDTHRAQATRVPRRNADAASDPTRRIFRIKDKKVVGYALLVEYLTAEESIRLQEQGLGGRRRIGAGVFTPYAPARPKANEE